jgi:hypothetical protein
MHALSRKNGRVWLGSLLALVLAQPVHAAQQTLSSAMFDVVYDDALVVPYGQPVLVGQSLVFTPVALLAESLNGNGLVTVDADLALTIKPHAGYVINTLSFTQRGDYLLRGAGSTVDALGALTVSSLSAPSDAVSLPLALAAPLSQADAITHNWSASTTLSLASSLSMAATQGVNIALDHSLTAFTSPSSAGRRRAMIQETFSSLDVSVQPATAVPEPGAWLMVTGGLLASMALRRRVR